MAGPAPTYQLTFTEAHVAACRALLRRQTAPQAQVYRASWLNQNEIYFSILQRKVLTPNAFPDLAAVEQRRLAFAALYNDTAGPFHWRFTRQHLEARLAALPELPPPLPPRPAPAPAPPLAPAAA
jgi:hypothetical protein